MKTKLLSLALCTLCTQLLCCVTTTTTAPDGTVTVTRSIDMPAFSKGADTLTTLVVDYKSGK